MWLLSDAPMGGPDEDAKLSINLSTAERDDLSKLPGIDDFSARAGLSADAKGRLAAMMRAMEKAGPYSRE